MNSDRKNTQENDDWENRQLCVDGNCIGVIGPDGRCKECGKPHPTATVRGAETSNVGPATSDVEISENNRVSDVSGQPAAAESEPGETGDDWEDRRLCSDGTCIGVIGPDGRCKECGKPYTGEAQ